jgi:hypothetical protein
MGVFQAGFKEKGSIHRPAEITDDRHEPAKREPPARRWRPSEDRPAVCGVIMDSVKKAYSGARTEDKGHHLVEEPYLV